MRAKHKERLAIIITAVVGLSIVTLLVFNAFKSNIVFFFTPTDIFEGKAPEKKHLRIGGMVKKGSLVRSKTGLDVKFIVTDYNKDISVEYSGMLPNLFREGQGVVAEGQLHNNNRFVASRVLAKHDENYMPPEVADALKKGKKKAGMTTSTLVEPR